MESLRSNHKRAKAAITFLYIMIGVEVFMLFLNCMTLFFLKSIIMDGQEYSLENMLAYEIWQYVFVLSCGVVNVIAIVKFIQWFRRAYYNLHLKSKQLRFSEGWTVAGWFVPVLFFYRPYQIMKELYNETNRILEKSQIGYVPKTSNRLLGFWWTLWVTITVLGIVDIILSSYAPTIFDEMLEGAVAGIVMFVFIVPVYILAIKIVKEYSAMEALLYELPASADL